MAGRVRKAVRSVRDSRRAALLIAFWILVVHISAVAQFSSGFLLTRPVYPNTSESQATKPIFDRAVVIVVDALRHDFVSAPADAPELPYLRHFPVHEITTDPRRSFSAKFLADPPTTTLQRLKGLTTGSLPAFIDAGSNFAGFKIEEDNWVSQAASHLGPVAFVGDDTWEALFAHEFSENFPFPSLNVRDLDTVDNGVKEKLPDLVRNSSNKLVIGHMLGVDHVGHRYGPNHPAMAQKLDETFAFVKSITELIDDRTVLFVFGDHGMDATGNHGGDSQLELEAALWVYSKSPVFNKDGPSIVRQIDLVPTISGILGLPIPFNSLGFPIRQAFDSKRWSTIVSDTVQQIRTYAETVGVKIPTGSDKLTPETFQEEMLRTFRDAWIEFDSFAIRRGLVLFFGSIVAMVILYNGVTSLNLRGVSSKITVGALGGAMCGAAASLSTHTKWDAVNTCLFWISTGALFGVLPILVAVRPTRPNWWTWGAVLFLAIEATTSFSNSFVIWEPRILQFLLATIIVLVAISCARSNSPLVGYLGVWYGIAILVTLRISSVWSVCREETAAYCVPTFFEDGSLLSPVWTLFGIGALGLILPIFLRRFWVIGQNDVGIASLMLNMTPLVSMLSVLYWTLDNAEARGWLDHDMVGLQAVKILTSRLGLGIGLVGGIIIWARSNIPIEIVLSKSGTPEKIEGYNNLHGAYSLLTVVSFFWALEIVNKPPAILALGGLTYCGLSVLDLLDVSSTKYTMLTPVIYDLLAHCFFYFTGHQATFQSIQWDIAFVATPTVSSIWSPLSLLLNTLGPFLICGIITVSSAMWRRPPFKDSRQPVAFVLRAMLGAAIVSAIRAAASMLAASILRRHLMTWKIFAPRFMFGAIALLSTDVACIIALIINGHTIKKIAEMFG